MPKVVEDFLAENNVAGQTLLRLVSRGNAIIAEIFRLSEFVPDEFRLATKENQRKYADILLDFSYFKATEFYTKRIDDNAELLERDEEFQENHIRILTRFYLLFESIYKYVKDLLRYLVDLEDGVFIQQTLESIIGTTDGKQLLAESLFLYGVMLITLDNRIEGVIRERMLVAYSRYKSDSATSTNLDDVCKLCRSTGFSRNMPKRLANYPDDYFKRIPLPRTFISMVISRLRTDDVYNQVSSYPNPEHRSTALANQATMLYVILYFAPEMLQNDMAKMREIVDKHFPDNWVIAYYMGVVVDLTEAWEPYKAAKAALNNTIQLSNVKELVDRYQQQVKRLIKDLEHYLTEGVLTETFVLDSINKLMNCLRDCNVTIRWLVMHTNSRQKKLREMVLTGHSDGALVSLILNTSQLEFRLKNMFNELLQQKKDSWVNNRKEASERMIELSEYFSGEKALTRVTKNEALQAWFQDIGSQIASLDYADATVAGRKIVQLMQALEEVQEFHQLESNLQVRAFLAETRSHLLQMIRNVNVKEEVLVTIQLVADMSYAWQLVDRYKPIFQTLIKRDPATVIKLRALFLKLQSILDLPLVRISQANSRDVVSVAEYYSGELVEFIRQVLQVIPASMFTILNEIVQLQTARIKEVPTRLEKDRLKDFAQLPERYELARRTYSISVFTEGMLAMETTLVGVIQVNPKQLLEDGIRRELVLQVARAMDEMLVFVKSKPGDLEQRLLALGMRLDGFRRSFEYIQDYVNIYALKIWQEELSRIIQFNVERECNSFLKTRVLEFESRFQSTAIPIPAFSPRDDKSVDFIGRLGREIMNLSDSRTTVYVHAMATWYDSKTFKDVVGLKTFTQLYLALGAFGLTGVDRLYSFMIVRILQRFSDTYRRVMKVDKVLKAVAMQTAAELEPLTSMPNNSKTVYGNAANKMGKFLQSFTEYIVRLGQLQLLRRLIGNELSFRCKLESYNLANTLKSMNKAVLFDVENHYRDKERFPYPSDENPLMFEISTYLETSGMNEPFQKIYITTKPLDEFPLLMFLYVISELPKFSYDAKTGAFMCKLNNEPLDGTPFVIGIITMLKQFHVAHTQTFLAYLGQYLRSTINSVALNSQSKPPVFGTEIINTLLFLEEFCKYSTVPRKAIDAVLPPFVFSFFKHSSS